jgi:hypothetical protein
MTRVTILFSLGMVLLLAVIGAACMKAAEKATEAAVEKSIEAQAGGDVDVDIDDGKMKVTDEESGSTMEVTGDEEGGTWKMEGEEGTAEVATGEHASLPAEWPAELPQYPGSTVEMSQRIDTPEGAQFSVTLKTSDSKEQVVAFYSEKAKAAGYKEVGSMSIEETSQQFYESDRHTFMVTCNAEEGATIATLMFGPKA